MILSFSTQINGKPTYFPDKILKCLHETEHSKTVKEFLLDVMSSDLAGIINIPDYPMIELDKCKPKLHTIREDKNRRWKAGVMIDFFINARTKNMFRFAPRIPVVSKQRIFMTYLPQCGLGFRVSINGRQLAENEVEQLAINDGFEAVEDFEDYFIAQMEDDQYSGKIIHWTDFKY